MKRTKTYVPKIMVHKVVLRGKFIAINAYTKKQGRKSTKQLYNLKN